MIVSDTLLYFTLTFALYQVFVLLHERARQAAWLSPVAWTIAAIVIYLRARDIDYQTYFSAVHFLHFLLGPATVALAIPLYEKRHAILKAGRALLASLLVGSLTGIVSSVIIARLLRAPDAITRSLAPKSVTSPIAMAIAEQCGGIPALSAMVVIVTGVVGALTLPYVFQRFRVRSEKARGFALGMAAHGLGTARAFQESNEMGAFAGLAIGLNGLVTAVLVPLVLSLFS